uniref:Uncharacterized protein n=1 Tax=Eucampia antarctica TaxID=49252 RepID=A0A7S2R1C9_9STRA
MTSSAKYHHNDSITTNLLLPYPIPLHTRKIRRCRKELAAGRTGILMKPKPNPLEGDSSLRSGHDQWWKKDSSAIHVVPKVTLWNHSLHHLDDDGNWMLSFVLKIQNPTLSCVSLQLGCHNGHAAANNNDECSSSSSSSIQNVILDPIYSTQVEASMLQQHANNKTQTFLWTDVISLEPMEDAALREWKNCSSTNITTAPLPTTTTTTYTDAKTTLLSCHQDEAFVEFHCPIDIANIVKHDETETTTTFTHLALPIQMRILIQPGSWELPSFLVSRKQQQQPTEEQEYVNFNLYVVCPSK